MLTAVKISLQYRMGQSVALAVRDVSLEVSPGEFVMVLGPSGSGKSSLLYLLSGLKTPSQGTIAWLGKDYRKLGLDKLCALRYQHFGFIFQQHFLVPYLTATENVCCGRDTLLRERANSLLQQLGLAGKGHYLPAQLSYGQRQRVAVARALIHEPAVVFADEPTASVDSQTASQVCGWLRDYCSKGHICIMATHDAKLLPYATTVYEISDGYLKEYVQVDRAGSSRI